MECGVKTEPDSFGVYLVCDHDQGHIGDHHAWLIGNLKITEWAWADGEP